MLEADAPRAAAPYASRVIPSELALRLGAFALVLATMSAWETLAPRRERALPRSARWPAHAGLVVLGAVATRIVVPAGLAGVAAGWGGSGRGCLPALGLGPLAADALAFAVLDLAIWAQHLLMHRVPLFWRLHRVHHSDPDFDATTAIRFHPIEIALSALWKLAVLVPLGASPRAVIAFEIALNGLALFNHANARLPAVLDRGLRLVLVTPDFHRVHHSVRRDEQDSNFGFCLTAWDRIFRRHRPAPRDGHERMRIGIGALEQAAEQRLAALLAQPGRRVLRREIS